MFLMAALVEKITRNFCNTEIFSGPAMRWKSVRHSHPQKIA
jgi:hypothetical protein